LPKDNNDATDDALCLGHSIQHAPAEHARDSDSMSLGASLLQGSHCGSNCNGDNDGGGGTHNQRSWTSQQMLCAPQPRSPPFIQSQKDLEHLLHCLKNDNLGAVTHSCCCWQHGF
jgi:hypothetical protein